MDRAMSFLILTAGLILAFVCSVKPAKADQELLEFYAEPDGFISVDKYGAVKRKTRWDDPVINVCWDEAPKSKIEEYYRVVVERAVVSSWPKHSDVRFIGWKICTERREKGIHIVVKDEAPRTKGLGRYLDGRPEGMVLNFEFNKWRPACRIDKSKDDCVRYLAVHEFGHALGFIHEHARSDAQECSADIESIGAKGVKIISEYDEKSIMNYCSPTWKMYGVAEKPSGDETLEVLSALDKYSVAKHYKIKPKVSQMPIAMENE